MMSLSYVKCYNDYTENWESVPILVWASDICYSFFNGLHIFPPYEVAKKFTLNPKFAYDVILGNEPVEWEPFELTTKDYNSIKNYFLTKFGSHYFELENNINSSREYIMWRREKKYGIPIKIQEEFFTRFDAAEKKFKSLENKPIEYIAAWEELNEIIAEEQSLYKLYKKKF